MPTPIPPSRGGASRRQFLNRCAGCALAAGCSLGAVVPAAIGRTAARATGKPRIRLVFTHTHPGQPSWPYATYDYEARKRALTEGLTKALPELELVPTTLLNADEAKKLVESDPAADGYLVCMVGIWTGAPAVLAATGKPTIFADDLYAGSGEFLISNAAALRASKNVAGVSSSRLSDVVAAARCLAGVKDPAVAADFGATCRAAVRKTYAPQGDVAPAAADATPRYDTSLCLEKMRDSSILLVGRPMQPIEELITKTFGTKVVPIDFPVLGEAYEKADPDQAKALAETWTKGAKAVVEPDAETIRKSAAMALGMKDLMAQHRAQAITINCLGGFYGGHMAAYPCLGFSQLNNEGQVGACEADMRSTLSMLLMAHLVGRPGYISDPVVDTSKHQIIYAHCVAMFHVDGPDGPANPYEIRSHSEDRKGASMRSLLPLGRLTTTIQVDPGRKQILLHQAKAVENVDEDKACRTKLAAEVKGDIDKLLSTWDQWGWHRVTFYGDLREPVAALADRIGFGLVEEA